MNERIISEMGAWFKKAPKPSKKELYLRLWDDMESHTMRKLKSEPAEKVLEWLRSNMVDSNMQGAVWMANCSKQVYAKLWSLTRSG